MSNTGNSPSSNKAKMSESSKNSRLMLAGGIAGVVSRSATAPIERVKLLRQTNNGYYKGKSMIEALKFMIQKEGIRGCFKGNGANVVKVAPFSSLEFFIYDFLKLKILEGKPLTFWTSLMIGGITGATASSLTYPLDLVKALLLVQVDKAQYKGITDVIKTIYKNEGVKGLYRGWSVTLMGIIPYIGFKMTAFNMTKKWIYGEHGHAPVYGNLAIGAFAGIFAVSLSYPTDVIKRRLQVVSLEGSVKYDGIFDCISKTYQRQGIRGFYSGLVACYWKVIPSVSISFTVNNSCKNMLGVSGLSKRH